MTGGRHSCGAGVSRMLAMLALSLMVSIKGDTPRKMTSFDDIISVLYKGAPIRVQIDNATACLHSRHSASASAFWTRLHGVIGSDVGVAMVTTSIQNNNQRVVLTWNERILDGAIFNSTGPIRLTTQTSVFENGTLSVVARGQTIKEVHVIYTGSLSCRWTDKGKSTREAVIFRQDKGGAILDDYHSLTQALGSGFSVAYDLDLGKMQPPGQGRLVARMSYVTSKDSNQQLETSMTCCNNGTTMTHFRVITQASGHRVTVIQRTYSLVQGDHPDGRMISSVTRKGTLGSQGCLHFLVLPYDS